MKNNKILIVEDDYIVSFALKKYFEAKHYEVDCASDGLKALEKFGLGADLVILDINLPNISGFDVAKKIRSSKSSSNVPIIFFSALSQDSNIKYGFDIGATEYITKPSSMEYLFSRVEKYIQAS
ncbi:MAG: response regulator transcription factor [Candidatus Sericytochromatia bacterium]